MAEFFKFLLLITIDIVLSGTGAYFVLKKLEKYIGTGTGAIGEAIMAWLVAVVSFFIMIILIGMLLYWLMFVITTLG